MNTDNATATMTEEGCDCFMQCHSVTYSSTVSSARLSDSSILSGNRMGANSSVAQSFADALEVAQRVDEDSMMLTLRLVQNVLGAHEELKRLVRFNVASDSTSVSRSLQLFSASLFKMLQQTVKSNRVLHDEMNEVYLKYVYYLVNDLTTSLDTADLLFTQVTAAFVADADNALEVQALIDVLDHILDKLENFDTNLNATSAYARFLFPKRLLNSQACVATKNSLNGSLVERKTWLASGTQFDAAKDLPKIADACLQMSRLSSCLQNYHTELRSFSTWLNSVEVPSITGTTLTMSTLDSVDDTNKYLRRLFQAFVGGWKTKGDLAHLYLTRVDRQMLTVNNQLVESAKSVFVKLSSDIDVINEWMMTFFEKLFAAYATFQNFMATNDKRIESYARRDSIWRLPVVNFQSSQASLAYNTV